MNKQRREGAGSAPKTIPPIKTNLGKSVPGTGFKKK